MMTKKDIYNYFRENRVIPNVITFSHAQLKYETKHKNIPYKFIFGVNFDRKFAGHISNFVSKHITYRTKWSQDTAEDEFGIPLVSWYIGLAYTRHILYINYEDKSQLKLIKLFAETYKEYQERYKKAWSENYLKCLDYSGLIEYVEASYEHNIDFNFNEVNKKYLKFKKVYVDWFKSIFDDKPKNSDELYFWTDFDVNKLKNIRDNQIIKK